MKDNTSCLILRRVADLRDDEYEAGCAGKEWSRDGSGLPACAAERGAFMSSFPYIRRTRHPYAERHGAARELYAHFDETTFRHPPFSAAAVPFGWMMKGDDDIPEKARALNIGYDPELEPKLPFDTLWVQERRNQLAMLDSFFGAIEPEVSLVFFYAKRTPLTDDPRRVLVGIGRVLKVDPPVEYAYVRDAPDNGLRCMLWERNLHHSIRPEMDDGFLLPYHDLLEAAASDPEIDLASLVLHAPEEQWDAFSMGAEHVSHDKAISLLIACSALVEKWEKIVAGDWRAVREWLDAQLNRLWRLRGAFPGLGSALTALGLEHGTLIAHGVGQLLHADGSREVRDPWPIVDKVIDDPSLLPGDLGRAIGAATRTLWAGLRHERRSLLQLLARLELSADQAKRWYVAEERARKGLDVTDEQILANPYLLFERDRFAADPIGLGMVDRALFPAPVVAAAVPVPAPSACPEAIDPRRLRAFAVECLDRAADEGHTLLPQAWVVQRVRDLPASPPCPLSGDLIDAFAAIWPERLATAEMSDGSPAWQLVEYAAKRDMIATRVRKRIKGRRMEATHDWRALIDAELPPFGNANDPEMEELARREKADALAEIYRSRISALVGPAGTGKTSLLSALLSVDEVARGGVLLLAPTGKARVQMQRRARNAAEAKTLAQFLLALKRYDAKTGHYKVTNAPDRESGYKTVVIDEASMLTEDQLAATLDALDPAVVDRIVLVGDPRQLPPIGAGRPFMDIISELRGDGTAPPKGGYAELKIVRRQATSADADAPRDDIVLSRWFSGEPTDPGADEAWERLAHGKANGVRAIRWDGEADLQAKLLAEVRAATRAIAAGAGCDLDDEVACFDVSLGGRPYNDHVYFNPSRGKDGKDARVGGGADVESWQVLSPIRPGEVGVDGLNRLVHGIFRRAMREFATKEPAYLRKVCAPMGSQGILYGDKVINTRNHRGRETWPAQDETYLANGEIGLVVGQFKGAKAKFKSPWKLEVEFSSQLGSKFSFFERDFGEERDAMLELAYALTVHKSQGSEFGTTFVVLPNPCRLLSRELLYTALTRQRHEVVLLHQGELRELMKYAGAERSETARRLTNLFAAPKPVAHGDAFLEDRLVHRTTRGELVRSKSEVIIANLLHAMGIPYAYEKSFIGSDGSVRYPDFTVDDAESGRRVFIEHLGMLDNPEYRRRWTAKLAWYRTQGVTPVDEGEADGDILLTTTEEGGIDAAAIEAVLKEHLA